MECADCGLPLEADQETVVIQPDFVVHKSCLEETEAEWEDTKKMLRSQALILTIATFSSGTD
jgi:hypothetical protein